MVFVVGFLCIQLNRVIFLVMGFLHIGHTSSDVAHSTHVPWPHRNAILRGFSRQMAHMLASSISRTWAWSDSKDWSVSKYFSSFSLNSTGWAGAFCPTNEKKKLEEILRKSLEKLFVLGIYKACLRLNDVAGISISAVYSLHFLKFSLQNPRLPSSY